MIAKAPFLVIFILFLVACQPTGKTGDSTSEGLPQPTLATMTLPLNTAVLPSPTPTTTSTPIPILPPPEPTNTPLLTLTSTPEPMLPTASLIFMYDNNLQKWHPITNEITTLTEDVTDYIFYSGEFVVFLREFIPDQDYALVVFHVPTQSEVELFRSSFLPTAGSFHKSISISPNGHWVAFVTGESRDSATLTVHEMGIENQQLTVSEPVLTITPGEGWNWPYEQMLWATENEISWGDESGIWIADLNSDSIEPVIAIAPSTNTFPFYSPNPDDWDKEPSEVYTTFIPIQWSPNGSYLLAEEYFDEYGELRIIERGTNRLVNVPESVIGAIADSAIWLDNETLLHYQNSGNVLIWKIDLENDPMIFLQETFPARGTSEVGELFSLNNHLRFYVFYSLFDLNLETGELIQLAQDIPRRPYWSPDGQYILWNETNYVEDERLDYVFWDNLNGDTPIELDSILGLHTCCWHWFGE
jgi:hypothetical protein